MDGMKLIICAHLPCWLWQTELTLNSIKATTIWFMALYWTEDICAVCQVWWRFSFFPFISHCYLIFDNQSKSIYSLDVYVNAVLNIMGMILYFSCKILILWAEKKCDSCQNSKKCVYGERCKYKRTKWDRAPRTGKIESWKKWCNFNILTNYSVFIHV